MICAEAKELLESYVKGSTDTAAREALEAHFASCEGCRLEAELTRSIHGQSEVGESGPPVLEPLPTAPLQDDPIAPPPPPPPPLQSASDDEGEISFRDLVLDVPDETPATASVATPPTPARATGASFGAPEHSESGPAMRAETSKANATGSGEAKSSAPTWDFEPVDPPRESGPPPESLNLAEQAVTRRAEAKAKGKVAALRVVLWAAGGLSGLALLGVSVWIALAFKQPPVPDPGQGRQGEASQGSSVEPRVEEPAPVDGSLVPDSGAPSPEGGPAGGSGESQPAPPDGSVQTPAGADAGGQAAAPSDGRVIRAGSLSAAGGGPSGVIAPTTPKPAKPTSAASGTRTATTPPKPATAAPAPSRQVAGSSGSGSGTPTTSSGGARKALGPQPAVDDLEPVSDESEIPFTTAPKRTVTHAPTPNSAGSTQAGGSAKPAPEVSAPTAAPSAGSEGEASTAPSPEPKATKPIDRLHEATVQATTAEDVEALRKLKVSWKTMIRTASATERARAKREYADCLWAIQELSGRVPDRKEALAAYREYVLYAPAGANDARTVGRMRYLEDVLSESE